MSCMVILASSAGGRSDTMFPVDGRCSGEVPMELSEVIAKRRSVRRFNTKLAVSDSDIDALLEAAIAAPEGC